MHSLEQIMYFPDESHYITDLKHMVLISNIYNFYLNDLFEDMIKSKDYIKIRKVLY